MNRGSAWSDEEIKALLSIWGDSKVQDELDGAVRNKTVFVDIQKQLAELGYERDWRQCRSKVKNLKAEYRKVKDNNGETGSGRKTCRFFDGILGHRPASVPSILLDTATGTSATTESQSEERTNSMVRIRIMLTWVYPHTVILLHMQVKVMYRQSVHSTAL